jgi:hypothetical protein
MARVTNRASFALVYLLIVAGLWFSPLASGASLYSWKHLASFVLVSVLAGVLIGRSWAMLLGFAYYVPVCLRLWVVNQPLHSHGDVTDGLLLVFLFPIPMLLGLALGIGVLVRRQLDSRRGVLAHY